MILNKLQGKGSKLKGLSPNPGVVDLKLPKVPRFKNHCLDPRSPKRWRVERVMLLGLEKNIGFVPI